ncbi:MAG: CNNM domain-containing protein [Bacteroidota bacterium]
MTLLLVYVAIAIGVSFICSIMEAVLLSVTPAYIGALEEDNPSASARLKKLKEDIDEPLSGILTLNTFAHTIGAAGAGAQANTVFGETVIYGPLTAEGLFAFVLTLAILFLSEIIPKTIGAVYWKPLAPVVGAFLRSAPFRWSMGLFVILSKGLTRLIARGEKEQSISREELVAMANIGVEEGVFAAQESQILTNLLRLGSLRTKDVMTPRTVLVAFTEDTTAAEAAEQPLQFSRLPIYDSNLDSITGYVLKDDLLQRAADDEGDTPLAALRRDLLTVPDSLPLMTLFQKLLEGRDHIALVVGEYGGTSGIVTMEDVVETLLGTEIVDEADTEQDMQHLARRQWAQRARRLGLLDDVDLDNLDDATRDAAERVGGLEPDA